MKTPQDLARDLAGGSLAEQAQAAEALALLGKGAQPAIRALVTATASPDEAVAQWATSALENVGPPASDHITDLGKLAANLDANIAYWTVTLLGRAGPAAAPALPVLIQRLEDASAPHVQERAAWALGQLGPGEPGAVAALRRAAQGSGRLAKHAERALGQ